MFETGKKQKIKEKLLFGLLIFLFLCGCQEKASHRYHLSICAMFKNEARWLKEWILYHRDVMKVGHFYLYNNESEDDYLTVLNPFIEEGIVELLDWDSKDPAHLAFGPFMDAPWNAAQIGAYNDCLKRLSYGVSKWVAMIDIDEFIVPSKSVKHFYKALEKAEKNKKGTVSLEWRVFGTSGIQDLEEGERLIEAMTKRSEDSFSWNRLVKSIHRPEAVDFCLIHVAEKLKPGYGAKTLSSHVANLNHYWTRTEKFCFEKRGALSPELLSDLSKVEDRQILKIAEKVRQNGLSEAFFTKKKGFFAL